MSDRGLSPLQALILLELLLRGVDDAPLTPSEIAENIAPGLGIRSWDRKPVTEAETVARALRRMRAKGWVERTGTASTGAGCWAITDGGREALPIRVDDRD